MWMNKTTYGRYWKWWKGAVLVVTGSMQGVTQSVVTYDPTMRLRINLLQGVGVKGGIASSWIIEH
jgi:hypothetical protein